ncbi:MAG: hypothetical protein R3D03_07820 [Geminicoccaceae bacterium]
MFHAFGFSGHGFQLSPIVGLVSELVLDGRSSLPIDAFSPTRFDNPGLTGGEGDGRRRFVATPDALPSSQGMFPSRERDLSPQLE